MSEPRRWRCVMRAGRGMSLSAMDTDVTRAWTVDEHGKAHIEQAMIDGTKLTSKDVDGGTHYILVEDVRECHFYLEPEEEK